MSRVKVAALLLLFAVALGAVLLSVAGARERIFPVHVEHAGESAAVSRTENAVNLNTATEDELTALPGIGETLAARILAYRAENGRFHDIGELREIEGIGSALLEKLAPYIVCE